MSAKKWGPDVAALRHRDFALYVSANFLTTIALQIQATALAFQIYAITGDMFQLGLVGLAEFLPAALLALPAGHLADRIDRRLLILIGVTAELFAALALVFLASTDRISEGAILSLALCFGIARAIATPAARALMPNLVPKEYLPSAVAWSSTSWQVATIAGPGLGGQLYSGFNGWLYPESPAMAYGGAALGFVGAVLLFFLMHGRSVTVMARKGSDFLAMLAGLVLIVRNRLLLSTISLDLFAVLFSGATALIPVFAQDILHVDAGGAGILRSAQGVGATVTALLLTQFPLQRHVGRRLFMAVGLFGVAAIVFGLSRDFWLSAAAMLVLGAADMVSVFIRATLVPLATPDELRGRVTAVESVFIGASNELGAFVAGAGGALLGAVPAVLVGGSMTVLITLSWAVLFPNLRRLDRFADLHARDGP
ncbi:MAG: MFS transporter [Rhodospirillum sp.]|nr:MFS transporter [Rhodospirillum sp.]